MGNWSCRSQVPRNTRCWGEDTIDSGKCQPYPPISQNSQNFQILQGLLWPQRKIALISTFQLYEPVLLPFINSMSISQPCWMNYSKRWKNLQLSRKHAFLPKRTLATVCGQPSTRSTPIQYCLHTACSACAPSHSATAYRMTSPSQLIKYFSLL